MGITQPSICSSLTLHMSCRSPQWIIEDNPITELKVMTLLRSLCCYEVLDLVIVACPFKYIVPLNSIHRDKVSGCSLNSANNSLPESLCNGKGGSFEL